MSSPEIPDFRDLIAQFDNLADEWGAQAERLQAATAQAGSTITRPELTLTVSGVRIVELTFAPAAISASPVQLRESLLTAYAEGLARANNSQANAVASITGDEDLAAGMRGSVTDDVRERTRDVELESEHGDAPAPAAPRPSRRESLYEWLSDPGLDQALVSEDINETMSDVEGWDRFRPPPGDPSMWQYELEQQVRSISERAAELKLAMEQVTAEQDSKFMILSVNAAGRLLGFRTHKAFASADPKVVNDDFSKLYNTATAQASHEALQTLSGAERPDDDPTVGYFASTAAAAEQAITEPADDGRGDPANG